MNISARFTGILCGITILGACIFAPPARSADTARLSRTPEGLYLAEAKIGDESGLFIIDTGAAISAIEPGFAQRAGLEPPSTYRHLYGLTQVEILPTSRIEVRSSLAGRRQTDTAFLHEPLPYPPQADGLLGLNAILPAGTGVLEIDFPSGYMRLHEVGEAPDPILHNAWLDISAPTDHPSILLTPVKVDGVAGEALIDTGIPFIVMNRAYARALEKLGRRRPTELTGFSEEEETPEVLRVRNIQLGAIALRNSSVYVLDAPVFEALGRTETPLLILGAPAFQDLKLLIDTKTRRFIAAPPDYFGKHSPACTGSRISCSSSVTRMTRSER